MGSPYPMMHQDNQEGDPTSFWTKGSDGKQGSSTQEGPARTPILRTLSLGQEE